MGYHGKRHFCTVQALCNAAFDILERVSLPLPPRPPNAISDGFGKLRALPKVGDSKRSFW
jgi:hypothetical protein